MTVQRYDMNKPSQLHAPPIAHLNNLSDNTVSAIFSRAVFLRLANVTIQGLDKVEDIARSTCQWDTPMRTGSKNIY